jgi:hypothetical protein
MERTRFLHELRCAADECLLLFAGLWQQGSGIHAGNSFGYKARVPLVGSRTDRTEVDMKLGTLLVAAKLTESDFQVASRSVLESYRDFKKVFEVSALPRSGDKYASYQLIRNVLAAHASGLRFWVMVDARRADLIEAWYAIMCCVRDAELGTRCKLLTWQEVNWALPQRLQDFLEGEVRDFSVATEVADGTDLSAVPKTARGRIEVKLKAKERQHVTSTPRIGFLRGNKER